MKAEQNRNGQTPTKEQPVTTEQPKITVVVYTGGGCGEKRIDAALIIPTQKMN